VCTLEFEITPSFGASKVQMVVVAVRALPNWADGGGCLKVSAIHAKHMPLAAPV
jgi:hypothetical protein